MLKDIRRLPDSELELMQIIWQQEPPVSRLEIEQRVCAHHALAPTTILTLLPPPPEKRPPPPER